MLKAAVVAFALAGMTGPAFAQSLASPGETTSPMEDAMAAAFWPCFNLATDTTTSNARKVEICTAAIVELDKAAASKTPTERELNTQLALRAQLHSRIMTHYLHIDTVRSKRTCDQAEAAFADIGRVKGQQLRGFQQILPDLLASAKSMAKTCRADFGTPAGAPAVD